MPNPVTLQTNTRLLNFRSFGDSRGQLCALEALSEQIPFEIKRVYYMWDVGPDQTRGHHAHYRLKQVLVCLSGSCDVVVEDATTKKTIRLDSPLQGLLLDGKIWHYMEHFSPNCVLMVLASDHYQESDYIRDYDQFLKEMGK